MPKRNNPKTSKDAFEKIRKYLSPLQQTVYLMLRQIGPCTDHFLVRQLKARHGREESTWRTRRNELVQKGFVSKCGERDGRSVWRTKNAR
jgi:predicted transcriptional regulator